MSEPDLDVPALDVLIPTFRRAAALAVTLTSLTAQTLPHFRVVVSDQTEDGDGTGAGEVQTAVRLLRAQGRPVELHRHLDDVRPHQQAVELWDGPVQPERVEPGGPAWARHSLHSAANSEHVARRLGATDARPVVHKVAWVGGCVLYDVAKLRDVGGFGFWPSLPEVHCGEDVLPSCG